jgi:hypothetical protein
MVEVSQPPEKSNKQAIAEMVGEAGLSLVPVVGGPIVAAWTRVVGAAYEQRRERWEAELVEAVPTSSIAWIGSHPDVWRETKRSWMRSPTRRSRQRQRVLMRSSRPYGTQC